MSEDTYRRSVVMMGTIVTIDVAARVTDVEPVDRAFEWFQRIEECCSRFLPESELMQLTSHIGDAVPASAILYEAVRFSLQVAEVSGGAFDPTVGSAMESRGYNREHRSGQIVETDLQSHGPVSFRDVRLNENRRAITLMRPMILDLGGVAKGLAIDMAARELAPFENFAIDAGGDLYLGGCRASGEAWSVGIRHPELDDALIETIRVSNRAVCTSGQYERPGHILDPRAENAAIGAASVTVVAPTAMMADALATAAFVLGPGKGIQLLNRLGVEGVIYSKTLERHATTGMCV